MNIPISRIGSMRSSSPKELVRQVSKGFKKNFPFASYSELWIVAKLCEFDFQYSFKAILALFNRSKPVIK